MTAREVLLEGGSPWGFRMNGGADVGHALRISRVNPGSKAAQRGVREGDVITSINGQPTKCLTNGDSHALLRSVGDTLRLGLNQDTNGSPKRRNKEPLKREASSGSTQSTPSTPGAVDAAPASTDATPSDETEPSDATASTGAKVFVCGIWNSVHKTKRNLKNDKGKSEKQEKQEESEKPEDTTNTTTMSSSKARRLRRMKLKSAKREEHAVDDAESPIVEEPPKESTETKEGHLKDGESIDVVVVMDEEEVRRAGGVVSNDEIAFSEKISDEIEKPVLEISENRTTKTSKTKTKKKNNKNKVFSLSNIFSSKGDKKHGNEKRTESQGKIENDGTTADRRAPSEKSVTIIPAAISEASKEIVQELLSQGEHQKSNDNHSQEEQPKNGDNNKQDPKSMCPSVKVKESPVINSSTIFTIIETETITSSTSKTESLKSGKISSIKLLDNPEVVDTTKPGESSLNTNLNQSNTKNIKTSDKLQPTEIEQTRPISIFVVPPDNVAEETESNSVDWESVSDFDTSSHVTSSDDDVRPETLIHLPSNDLQTATVDGRNGIVQVSDYELSVQDLSCPLMDPEEEARLRRFLETLNLTRPEEYDDTPSTKSYGDSSSTLSETSPIPPQPASDEVVVYRHLKSHSIAEPCFIPPRHHHHLDVITEETSDPSDSEKINASKRPWENPDLIRKNNEIDSIPNDWYGSDEEPETTSDEGGIDTSWRDGRKLEDVEGVEVVYLSDDSDDEETFNKTFEENLTSLQNYSTFPELVVVHTVDRQEENNSVKLPRLVRKINNMNTEKQTVSQEKIKIFSTDQPKQVTIFEINSNSQINNKVDDHELVNLRLKEKKKIQALDEDKLKTHSMDEIVAIIDNTYEINKDIFAKPSSIEPNFKRMKTSNSTDNTDNEVTGKIQQYHQSELKDTITDPKRNNSVAEIINDVELDHLNCENNSHQTKLAENLKLSSLDNVTPVQDVIVAMTPPILSRQESSSSATSQSTAKYNPGHSPMSSEAEDRAEQEPSPRKKHKKVLYNPKSLSRLSTDVISLLPHGEFYLKRIGVVGDGETEIPNNEGNTCGMTNGKLTSLPPSGISTRRSSLYELENIFSPYLSSNNVGNVSSLPMPVLIKSPPPSALESPAPNDDPWVGLPTSMDERVLVCLSPSQSRDSTMNTPKEATELLDLHKKFVERRGYHESSKRNSMYSPKSERSCTPDLGSPDLIRLEPYESKKEQVYTPELLIEAANLLALKEYRRSRFRNSTQSKSVKTPETTRSVKTNGNVSKKNEGLSGVTSPEPEIAADSGGPDSNRSAGTSRLLALLQGSDVPHSPSNITTAAPKEMSRVDNSVSEDRVHRCSGSYLSEWLTMSENVTSSPDFSNMDSNKDVIGLRISTEDRVTSLNNVNNQESVERRQFEAEKYKISKQGDIAIIQSKDDGNGKPPIARKERPKSMPPIGVPALTPSGGELFREQMYHEYMNKVAERTERRQQKVIKISSRPSSMYVKPEPEPEKNAQNPPPVNQLESEFMVKVRERMSKLGINFDDEEEVTEDNRPEEQPAEELPKHLQEFIELTTAPLADPAPAVPTDGVWSPGATPEPQRKEFNFSAVKEEVTQEDLDPVQPVWTPRSAQASPTPERKAFRPVNFESPKLSRKTYNHKPSEEVPKPPTDLPLPLDSPSHSQTSSLSSTQQISRETVTSSTLTTTSTSAIQESSSRLVSSHSLPDTSLPRAQNPTITLLQKAREGQLPRGAHYLEQNNINEKSDSPPPAVRPNEILYSIRREYESENEDKRPKKLVDLTPRKYDGIGPVTKEGIPIVLRSEVQDENQQKWYKRMYDSLHRAEKDKDYLTVKYKARRDRYPYSSAGGYLSEPEPVGGYDSDYTTAKYATLDRRRIRNKDNDFTTSTMPRGKYNAVKHAVDVYKNQPGRIEDYEPGHSSIADKETKQWWDEVMDIFDGQFEQTQKSPPRTHAPTSSSTNKPFMTYALKESGYESDSTLVFKRRDETAQQLSPAEQRQAYKAIQRGGDVPLHGLRKPVPDKPKESPHRYVESEVTIHYRSPVRSEEKQAWSEEELQRRQAEAMRRIYQEERRRKYLQELQDMYSRRHTDNFTPSQKSPIPLNRYDDFVDDLSPNKARDRTPEPKLVARALYNFVGQTSRELTFRRGDIIYVRRQIDKNWYEGEHNAMIGLFPFNYVEIIPYDGIRTLPKRPTEGQARAKFNFQAQTHLELPLVKGELVLLTRRVDNNWFEGRIGTRKGIFPVSYVEVLVEPGERAMSPVRVNTPTKPVASPAAHSLHVANNMSQHHYQPPRPVSYTSLPRQKTTELKQPPVNQTLHIDTQNEPVPYRVLYNYAPQNDDELELVEGETVYVMEKCDDGWYVGSSQRTGYLGTFPGNYVQRQV